MLKKSADLTRPTPARRDAPFRGQGRRSAADPRFTFHCSWSNARTMLADFFSILLVLLLCTTDGGYHPVHATHLGTYRPTRGALPHRSHYHPAHTGCDGGRPNRMDTLSDRISSSSRGSRADRMDLDRHGLRHLWNGRIGIRPRHSHEHPGRSGRNWHPVPLQCDEWDRELFIDPVRRARIFIFIPGDRASRIPSSQSSVPFFIRKTLIRSNPASVNQALVSAAE